MINPSQGETKSPTESEQLKIDYGELDCGTALSGRTTPIPWFPVSMVFRKGT